MPKNFARPLGFKSNLRVTVHDDKLMFSYLKGDSVAEADAEAFMGWLTRVGAQCTGDLTQQSSKTGESVRTLIFSLPEAGKAKTEAKGKLTTYADPPYENGRLCPNCAFKRQFGEELGE